MDGLPADSLVGESWTCAPNVAPLSVLARVTTIASSPAVSTSPSTQTALTPDPYASMDGIPLELASGRDRRTAPAHVEPPFVVRRYITVHELSSYRSYTACAIVDELAASPPP